MRNIYERLLRLLAIPATAQTKSPIAQMATMTREMGKTGPFIARDEFIRVTLHRPKVMIPTTAKIMASLASVLRGGGGGGRAGGRTGGVLIEVFVLCVQTILSTEIRRSFVISLADETNNPRYTDGEQADRRDHHSNE